MRTLIKLIPLVLFGVATGVQACGSIKADDLDYANGGRRFPVVGVIQGTVLYQGLKPCSANGHIIGNALLLVFDAKNPPPPDGLATSAVNFVAVAGDTLFSNLPREPGPTPYCPKDNGDTEIISASAPYAISPMDAGQYLIQSFFDFTGDFLPTFSFRRLPVAGDIGGGHIDTNDPNVLVDSLSAQTVKLADGGTFSVTPKVPKSTYANYAPVYQRIDVGIPGPIPVDSVRQVPTFTMPPEGFIADNVSVAIGLQLPLRRPYFYAEGSEKPGTPDQNHPDPNTVPLLTMPQDLQVLAKPGGSEATNRTLVDEFQKSFPNIRLNAGLPTTEPTAEYASAIDRSGPFHLQLLPPKDEGLFVWWNGTHVTLGGDVSEDTIPEGQVPRLWPLVVFAKLKDDPNNLDPQGLIAQGADGREPIVIIQGITLATVGGDDSLYATVLANINGTPIPKEPTAAAKVDHVSVMVRPSALCLDPRHTDRGGILVTPHEFGTFPPGSKGGATPQPLVDKGSLVANPQLKYLLNSSDPNKAFKVGCLPKGRYGINLVYPTGQAWTTPNEMGSCAAKEGTSDFSTDPGSCSLQPRPVLYSQGNRGVIEVGDPTDPAWCAPSANPVPTECTTLSN